MIKVQHLLLLLLLLPFYSVAQLSYAEIDKQMNTAFRAGDLSQCIELMDTAMDKAEREFGQEDSLYINYLSYVGFFHWRAGNIDQAERYFTEARDLLPKVFKSENALQAQVLNNMAVFYHEREELEKAAPIYEQLKVIFEKLSLEKSRNYSMLLNNLAILYEDLGETRKAEKLFLEALELKKQLKTKRKEAEVATSLNNLAYLYKNTGAYEKAEPLFLEALERRAKYFGKKHYAYAQSLNNLAVVYRLKGNYEKAYPLFYEAKDIRKNTLGSKHPKYLLTLNEMAKLFELDGQLDSAMFYCVKAISSNIKLGQEGPTVLEKLASYDFYTYSHLNESIINLLSVLEKQYEVSQDQSIANKRYQIAENALKLNERLKNEISGEGDKLRLLETNNELVIQGIESALELENKEAVEFAFAFAEQNKSILLTDAIKGSRARTMSDLPDSLALYEIELGKQLAKVKKQQLELSTEEDALALNQELTSLQAEMEAFLSSIKDKYPKYHALKYQNVSAKASEIQALLESDAMLIEFVITEKEVYVFSISKRKVGVEKIAVQKSEILEKVELLHEALSDYQSIQGDINANYKKYTETAFWFYQTLLEKTLKGAQGIEKLIIVTDGELGHLPFESFLTQAAEDNSLDYKALAYLLLDYEISYNYSATLWKENKENLEKQNNGEIFGMAANYESKTSSDLRSLNDVRLRAALGELPSARKEVESLAGLFKGFYAFDSLASESIFKERASDFSVIHLAMHGLLNQKYPMLSSLVFSEDEDSLENNFLQAYEISKMELEADLIVLSACETGFGRFETGNGIASLARAFMYAGSPALVVSLWQVNDQATSFLMQDFYKELGKGKNKAAALQQAKKNYIKKADKMSAHPAFWSPFILIGDDHAVKLSKQQTISPLIYWSIAGVCVLLLLLFLRGRKARE